MEKYNMREDLNKRQQKLFDKLDDTIEYTCVADRQGGDFAVERTLTIKGWVNQALEWEYMDDCLGEDSLFINSLLQGGVKAIEQIDDFWDITIVRVIRLPYNEISEAIKHWCNTCDSEWGGHDLAIGLIEDLEENQGGNCLDKDYEPQAIIVLTECQKRYIQAQCFRHRPYPSAKWCSSRVLMPGV